MKRVFSLAGLAALTLSFVLLATACRAGTSVAAAERAFHVTAIELKGATSTSKLAPPEKNPKDLSDAFGFDAPGVFDRADPTRWQVSAYIWAPGAMMAYKGDKVKLEIFVVNGDEHVTHIEDPDGAEIVKEQKQNRGRAYTISFAAEKAGLYKLICTNHDPSMTANILVMPRP